MADVQVTVKSDAVGCWEKYKAMIPVLTQVVAIILLILNVIFPGLGTAIMACLNTVYLCENLVIALLQFLTAPCLVGWIWSIIWGVFCVMRCV